jgi:hypothetical protein
MLRFKFSELNNHETGFLLQIKKATRNGTIISENEVAIDLYVNS